MEEMTEDARVINSVNAVLETKPVRKLGGDMSMISYSSYASNEPSTSSKDSATGPTRFRCSYAARILKSSAINSPGAIGPTT